MNKNLLALAAAAIAASSASAAVIKVGDASNPGSDANLITTNTFWTADNEYILDTVIFVKDGATLDIAPGTVVRGQPDESSLLAGSLVITPTGKVQIRGTKTAPVVFTTAALDADNNGVVDINGTTQRPQRWTGNADDANFWDKNPKTSPMPAVTTASNWQGSRNYAMWGGVVIAGDAPTNNANQVESDGVAGITNGDAGLGLIEGLENFGELATYGGVNTDHSAGAVKYVSIRHGGIGLTADKEINGLTCYSVGSGTTIENVDIYCTSDDGVEIFGGTVNMKNINVNYADDDGFDVDEGWRGSAQFIFVLQGLVNGVSFGDNGLEIDGEDKNENQPSTVNTVALGAATIDPLPYGVISNVTVWQQRTASNAARFRAGYGGAILNSIFQNISGTVGGTGLRIDGLTTSTATSGPSVGAVETEPSARTNFGTGLFQVRNNAVVGFTNGYTNFTANGVTMSAAGVATGTFTTGTLSGIVMSLSGSNQLSSSTLYPALLNRNTSTLDSMYTGLTTTPNHTAAASINPRPKATAAAALYGSALDEAYVPSPLVATGYKGAFDRTAASLWTTGWTALNLRGTLAN
jgi:hypothetical protein